MVQQRDGFSLRSMIVDRENDMDFAGKYYLYMTVCPCFVFIYKSLEGSTSQRRSQKCFSQTNWVGMIYGMMIWDVLFFLMYGAPFLTFITNINVLFRYVSSILISKTRAACVVTLLGEIIPAELFWPRWVNYEIWFWPKSSQSHAFSDVFVNVFFVCLDLWYLIDMHHLLEVCRSICQSKSVISGSIEDSQLYIVASLCQSVCIHVCIFGVRLSTSLIPILSISFCPSKSKQHNRRYMSISLSF